MRETYSKRYTLPVKLNFGSVYVFLVCYRVPNWWKTSPFTNENSLVVFSVRTSKTQQEIRAFKHNNNRSSSVYLRVRTGSCEQRSLRSVGSAGQTCGGQGPGSWFSGPGRGWAPPPPTSPTRQSQSQSWRRRKPGLAGASLSTTTLQLPMLRKYNIIIIRESASDQQEEQHEKR